jgi:hypothetical protein
MHITFNIIGLKSDLIGVVLLYCFGILPDNLWQHIIMDNGMKEEDVKKHRYWSKIALGFLFFGFIFQIVGNFVQSF